MAEDIVFYTNPQSRGRIARWALEETGVPYRAEVVPFGPEMKSAAYLSVNPMGKVPAIVHRGRVVTECAAITLYLAETFPDAGLAPTAEERADAYRWMFFAAGPLESAITNRALGVTFPPERGRMVGYGSFEQTMDTLEFALTRHPFVAGDRFTCADIYVGSHVGWGLMFGSIEKRPAFAEYFARVSDRDAYRRGNQLDDAVAA